MNMVIIPKFSVPWDGDGLTHLWKQSEEKRIGSVFVSVCADTNGKLHLKPTKMIHFGSYNGLN